MRIVGGHKAPTHYGRFHVSLQNLTRYHVCGGAVVSDQHIITAAHCVYGYVFPQTLVDIKQPF